MGAEQIAIILETNVIFPLNMAFSPLLNIPVLLMVIMEFTGVTQFRMVNREIHGQTVTWILADTVSQHYLFGSVDWDWGGGGQSTTHTLEIETQTAFGDRL